MNAEFWRQVRKYKKAILSKQCKETEENNRMGKTRHLFKEIRGTKATNISQKVVHDKGQKWYGLNKSRK